MKYHIFTLRSVADPAWLGCGHSKLDCAGRGRCSRIRIFRLLLVLSVFFLSALPEVMIMKGSQTSKQLMEKWVQPY